MSDSPPPTDAGTAFNKFMAISVARLSGALIFAFGLAIATGRFGWIDEDRAPVIGTVVAVIGFIQMIVMPRYLIRAFRSPPER